MPTPSYVIQRVVQALQDEVKDWPMASFARDAHVYQVALRVVEGSIKDFASATGKSYDHVYRRAKARLTISEEERLRLLQIAHRALTADTASSHEARILDLLERAQAALDEARALLSSS